MTPELRSQPGHAPSGAIKFTPSIQYLRAVAALLVASYHVMHHWLPQYHARYDVLTSGVDIFFVISGFVMWGVTAGREGGSWLFFSKRLKRIVPLYWIVTTAMLAIVLIKPALLNTRFNIAHVVASYLFIPWHHPVSGEFRPLLIPGWTLNYEMLFYVIFALILFMPMRFRLRAVVGVLVGIVALGSITHPTIGQLAFYTDPIMLEFAMGVCLGAAVTAQRRVPAPVAAAAALVGVGLLIASAFTGFLTDRGLIWGIPATLVVAGCVFLERETGAWLARLPLLLGDASYSIYLVHMSTALAVFQVWRKVDALHNPVGMVATMIVALLASAGAGVLVYWIVERPIVRHFRVPTPESRPLIAQNGSQQPASNPSAQQSSALIGK
ncbi:MAG: acyltransferase [Mycobacterium sp.]|uniref:acyltransferase family protein n=1 Tax=Mycobacterium sp. TaxID=1785 RepID=UPI001EC19DEB|nr:acyltransferase [Mycobacterium sp.]MBW0017013.1 acyltransferase [Mycobacterium sp.]